MWTPEQLTQPAPWCSEPLQACPAFVTCSSQAPPALQPGVPGSPVRCPRLSRQVPPALQAGAPSSPARRPRLCSHASLALQSGVPGSPGRCPQFSRQVSRLCATCHPTSLFSSLPLCLWFRSQTYCDFLLLPILLRLFPRSAILFFFCPSQSYSFLEHESSLLQEARCECPSWTVSLSPSDTLDVPCFDCVLASELWRWGCAWSYVPIPGPDMSQALHC